jgi:glycosyl-4,4'-diaponeurosporenoate acyltransferase
MPIELPLIWVIVLNCAGWPVIQLGLAWLFTRMPESWFDPPALGSVKLETWLYDRVFHVKNWKDKLPDAAAWFGGGFAKRELTTTDPAYLRRFIRETWRGELCHWCAFAFLPVFFLWNPWWADGVMAVYAISANLPCILAQRHNRIRLRRVLARKKNPHGFKAAGI